ncbi:MAG: hypothetical protein WHS65_12535 [Melioribacteraceae bacterium]
MKKYFFFFLLLSFPVNAQNLLEQLNYANKLYKSEKYYDAITEYKRLIFFDTSKTFSYICNFNIGKCYKAGGKLDDAIKYFSLAEVSSNNSAEKYRAKIEIVKTNLLRGTPERALQILNDIENSTEFSQNLDSLNYWRGWTFIFSDDWEKAKFYFNKFQPYHELAIISQNIIKEKYSVTFAKVISYILPGAGQIYTGHIFSGLISFGYNLLFGYLTAKSFSEDRIFDGVVIGSLLWLRFYRGNIQNAEKFVVEKNISISNRVLNYLQNEYRGDKP